MNVLQSLINPVLYRQAFLPSCDLLLKRTFATTLSQQRRVIYYSTMSQLTQQWDNLSKHLRKDGYVVLNPISPNCRLAETCRLFGDIQNHYRAVNKDGEVEVRSNSLAIKELQPHTDGFYLDGVAIKSNTAIRVLPPKIVILQCIKPSPSGGESIVVDGEAIFHAVVKNDPHLLTLLFSKNASSIGKKLVVNCSVFDPLPNGNIMLRYNNDSDLYIARQAKAAMDYFHENYVLNPKYRTLIPLSRRQILIIDNQRSLHGRTSFEGDRLFKRVWIHYKEGSLKMENSQQDYDSHYVFTDPGAHPSGIDRYSEYLPIPSPPMKHSLKKVETGINFSKSTLEKRFKNKAAWAAVF